MLSQWRSTTACAAVFFFVILCCLCPTIYGEDECQKSNIQCYDCDSRNDTACNDPFNVTAAILANITTRNCHGCCVKVVRKINTPKMSIWRTCTTNLKINLFMVDHVCMEEAGNAGHMCFCETESCNGTPGGINTQAGVSTLLSLSILTSLLFSTSSFFTFSLSALFPHHQSWDCRDSWQRHLSWKHFSSAEQLISNRHFCRRSATAPSSSSSYRQLLSFPLLLLLTACIISLLFSSSFSSATAAVFSSSVW